MPPDAVYAIEQARRRRIGGPGLDKLDVGWMLDDEIGLGQPLELGPPDLTNINSSDCMIYVFLRHAQAET